MRVCAHTYKHTHRQTTAVRNCNIMMQWVQWKHAICAPKIRIFLATCKYLKIWLMFTCGCLFLYFNVLLCVFYKLQNNVLLWVTVLPLAQVTAPKPGFWFQMHILTMTTYLHLCLISAHSRRAPIMLVNRATTWQQLPIWYAVIVPPLSEKRQCCLTPRYLGLTAAMPVSRIDDVFGWLSRNDHFGFLLAFVSSPPRETQKSDCGEGSLHGVAHSSGLISDFTNEAQINLEREKVNHRLKMRGRLGSLVLSSGLKSHRSQTWRVCFWHSSVGALALIRCFQRKTT